MLRNWKKSPSIGTKKFLVYEVKIPIKRSGINKWDRWLFQSIICDSIHAHYIARDFIFTQIFFWWAKQVLSLMMSFFKKKFWWNCSSLALIKKIFSIKFFFIKFQPRNITWIRILKARWIWINWRLQIY